MSPRFAMLDATTADSTVQPLLAATEKQLGRLPNLYKAMANGPAALAGYLDFRAALVGPTAVLDTKMRERIALLVAELNGCEYCVSAHSFRGGKIGLTAEELTRTRRAHSDDASVDAALAFVRDVVEYRGAVSDERLAAVRAAGWSDAALAEMVAHVALNQLSNLFNHVARPDLDFPRVPVGTFHGDAAS